LTQGQTTFTWTGAINNNWNTAGNWTKVGASTSTFPNQNTLQNDQAIINLGAPVVNASFTNASLTAVTITTPGTLTLGNQTLTLTGSLTGSGSFIQTNGTLNVSGDVTVSTLTISGGTFVYNGAGAQSIKSSTYNNFTKSGAGTATLAGNVTAAATTVSAGILGLSTNDFSATTLAGAGTITVGSGNLSISGNNSHTGTFNPGTGTVTYTGGVQNIRSTTYNNLTFNLAGNKTASGATLTVGGTLTFTNSTLVMGGNALVLQGPVSWIAGNMTSSGSVTYNSASNQDVIPATAATFTKNGAGTATLFANLVCTAGVTLTAGTLDLSNFNLNATTLAGAGTLTAGSGIITLTGNNTHSGTFNAGTSTVVYNVNAPQTVQGYGATGYYNLTITNGNTKTLANALTVSNQFSYTGNGTVTIGNNASSFNHFAQTNGTITFGTAALSFSGNVNKTGGTYTAGSGILTFSGTGFVRSNTAITFSTGAATINGTRTIQGAGAVTLSNTTVNGTLSNKINLIANTALSGTGTFSNDSTASLLDVNFTGSGPSVSNFNVNTIGTVRYSAAGVQTTRSVAYYNLSTSNSGVKTLSVGTSVGNNLSVGSQTDCAFNLTIPGTISGTALLNITGNSTLNALGDYTSTGALTIAGTGAFNASGNVSHGGGTLTFNSSAVVIDGIMNGTGAVNLSGTGSLTFTGAGWTSTSGAFTPGGTTTTYSGISGSQTVRSTTYDNLTLSGAATKNYGTGATGAVSGIFNNPAGQKLIFPVAASALALNGNVTGLGELLGDPAGTLTIGAAGATNSLGTLYFDTTKAFGTINFNRRWNRAIQVRIGSSVRLIAYTFLGGFVVGGVEIADGQIFKVESTLVTPASTLSPNAGRLRYIMLGTGSKFVFEPSGNIPAGINLTFPVGPMPTASTPYDVLSGNANGTLNAAIIGATTINGTGTNFDDQILVGYNLTLSDGTIVGEISAYVSGTQITLEAPGSLVAVPAASTFRLIQAYRPVTIIPSDAVTGGSLQIGILNHSGGGITSGTNVPNVPSNRRTNFIYEVRATGGFPTSAIWTEALLSNDFNATIDDAKYSFFRWNGAFWIKLAADFVGPGGVPTNTQIRRNSVNTMPGVQTFILGQTGGVLPDDPTFSWTGAGGNNNWKQTGNWNVFPSGAGNWPDDIGHNVIIGSGGSGNPILQSGDSVSVKNIFHDAKQLTIQNNGILNVKGNYSFNAPILTTAGVGRLIQTGLALTGTNNSQFLTQLIRGSLLFTTEGGFIGAVQSIASNSSLTLHAIGGSTPVNIPDSSTFNIIVPTISAGGGNLTATNTSPVVAGTGFTSALNGRALYVGANLLVGFVSIVQSSTSLLLVNNSLQNATNLAYLVSSVIVPSGTASTNFIDGSKVSYNNSNADQTIAATTYSKLDMLDTRVGANTDITRYVNCPGRTITIRGQYRGRPHVKMAAALGSIWQFNHNSRMSYFIPLNSNSALGGIWENFPIAGLAGIYNVKWGSSNTDRIHFDAWLDHTNNWDFPAMESLIGSRFGNFSLVSSPINGRWVFLPGMSFTVNGSFFANNLTGGVNRTIRFGTNTVNPAVNLTLLGDITGLNQIQNNGAPIHQGNITIGGSGTISGDLFAAVSQLRNLTINRSSANVNLLAASNLTVTEKITVSNGTFGHTGSGTITAGSAAVSGIDVTGGTLQMSGSSNLAVISSGAVSLTGGTINLNNSGSVTVTGNYIQTGGNFNRLTNPSTFQGNFSATAGTTNFTGSTVSLTGSNAQSLTGSATGFAFDNLTVNKTGGAVTASAGKVKVTGTLNLPISNAAAVNTGTGNITLVSTNSATARIASILGGSIGGSNWTMERFVNGGVQGWYFLGTPVKSQTLGNWGDDFSITTPLTCPGTFTDIMDRNTVFRLAGDAVPINGIYPNETNGWRSPASCSVNEGEGYRVFLKSSFFDIGTSTIKNTGTMNSGSTPLPVTFNALGYSGGGWNLVANPFPSNIDWDAGAGAWSKSNILNAIYIWKGAGQYGSYVSGIGTNGVDNIIPLGQAFLVKTSAAPSLSVNEAAKTATIRAMYRTSVQDQVVRMTLEGSNAISDEMVVHFKSGSTDAFDGDFDASKMPNPTLNLYSILNNEKYSINGIEEVETDKILPLGISTGGAGNNQFKFSGISTLDAGITLLLKDNYLSQISEVAEGQTISFTTTSDPSSFGDSRFELIFSKTNGVTKTRLLKGQDLNIYPNPAKDGKITIETSITTGKIEIQDMLGRLVATKELSVQSSKAKIAISIPSGLYTVKVVGADGQIQSKKLIVE